MKRQYEKLKWHFVEREDLLSWGRASRRIISEVDIVSTETCISVTVTGGLRLTLKLVMCSNSTGQNP
jgi:hypothetical protein